MLRLLPLRATPICQSLTLPLEERRNQGGEDAVIRSHRAQRVTAARTWGLYKKRASYFAPSARPVWTIHKDDGVPVHGASRAGVPGGERREGPADGADRSFPIGRRGE